MSADPPVPLGRSSPAGVSSDLRPAGSDDHFDVIADLLYVI